MGLIEVSADLPANVNHFVQVDHSEQSEQKIPSVKFTQASSEITTDWRKRIIIQLNAWEVTLDKKMPNIFIQLKLDEMATYVRTRFAPLQKFKPWLDTQQENGSWVSNMALFLVKLPLRVAHRILDMLYKMISTALYALVHPIKALNHLVKQLIELSYILTENETWSVIGAGLLGTSLGNTLMTGTPLATIGGVIGSVMLMGGLTHEAFHAILESKKGEEFQAVNECFVSKGRLLVESALTGFCLGLLMGKIQHILTNHQPTTTPQPWIDSGKPICIRPNGTITYPHNFLSDQEWDMLNAYYGGD
ncbi:MAG: hypothetical protein ACHQUC_05525 [Chlamydiales bacterium]